MDIISTQKFVKMSPKKVRPVGYMIKKMTPQKAVEVLPYVEKRAALPLMKVIQSAIANAKNKGILPDKLIFKEIQINEAPRLKRGRPASRGMWHPYKRRMSHIRIVLTTLKSKDINPKSERVADENKEVKTKESNMDNKPLKLPLRRKFRKEEKNK